MTSEDAAVLVLRRKTLAARLADLHQAAYRELLLVELRLRRATQRSQAHETRTVLARTSARTSVRPFVDLPVGLAPSRGGNEGVETRVSSTLDPKEEHMKPVEVFSWTLS